MSAFNVCLPPKTCCSSSAAQIQMALLAARCKVSTFGRIARVRGWRCFRFSTMLLSGQRMPICTSPRGGQLTTAPRSTRVNAGQASKSSILIFPRSPSRRFLSPIHSLIVHAEAIWQRLATTHCPKVRQMLLTVLISSLPSRADTEVVVCSTATHVAADICRLHRTLARLLLPDCAILYFVPDRLGRDIMGSGRFT